MAANQCSVCFHADTDLINQDLAEGMSSKLIQDKYGVGHSSVDRHRTRCLTQQNAEDFLALRRAEAAFNFGTELHRLYKKSIKFITALEKELSDPDNPKEFFLGPQDTELLISYADWNDLNERGNPTRKKAKLSMILRQIDAKGVETLAVQTMAMDTRKLYLDCFKVITDRLDQIAKFKNYWKPEPKSAASSEAEALRSLVAARAAEKGIPFKEEMKNFLDRYATDRLRPEVKTQLISDLAQ